MNETWTQALLAMVSWPFRIFMGRTQTHVPQNGDVPKQVPYRRSGLRKATVWTGNFLMISCLIIFIARGLEYMLPIAFGAWVIVLCYGCILFVFFGKGYLLFIAPVADLHAGVLINRFFGRKAPRTDKESLGLETASFIEEVSSGIWNPIFFWQSAVYVDLKRHVPVGGREGTAYSKDEAECKYLWVGSVRAVQGYCGTLVRIGSEAAIRMAEGLTDAAVSEMINEFGYEEIPKNLTQLGERLKKHYSGDGTMSEKEEGMALAVERLILKRVTRSQAVQDSAELVIRTRNLATAAGLLTGDKSLTTKEAMNRLLIETGKGDNIVIYEGLEKFGGQAFVEIPLKGGKPKN